MVPSCIYMVMTCYIGGVDGGLDYVTPGTGSIEV